MSSSSEPTIGDVRIARWHAWWPVAAWLLVIALESTPMMGADHTFEPLRRVFTFFHGPFTFNQWWAWHQVIRKIGHVIGYGIFGALLFRAWWLTLQARSVSFPSRVLAWTLTLPCVFAIASLDELHQIFLPNRTGLFSDVLIDLGGALLALLFTASWRPKSLPSGLGTL